VSSLEYLTLASRSTAKIQKLILDKL